MSFHELEGLGSQFVLATVFVCGLAHFGLRHLDLMVELASVVSKVHSLLTLTVIIFLASETQNVLTLKKCLVGQPTLNKTFFFFFF